MLKEKDFNGRVFFNRDEPEATILQEHYLEVRFEFSRLNPGLDLPEKARSTGTVPAVRKDKLQLVLGLLKEYRTHGASVHSATKRDSEKAQLRTYLAFLELREAYRNLTKVERRALICASSSDLPRGVVLDIGEITSIAGISLITCDPRKDFEDFLRDSYMETDYMSAWSISGTEEGSRVRDEYYRQLEAKGLKVSEKK